MKTIAQQTTELKRKTIQAWKPFLMNGLMTPEQIEGMANKSAMNFLDQTLRCEYQVKKEA
jgi:hypothetical protein